ncbi:MAG: hypothetical protein KJ593_07595 [Candidatus Omnitrophica bacterium]|nr:hypothetical protein [Candidatus Omnitrophota bacterium]
MEETEGMENMETPEEMEGIEEAENISLDATKEADELIEQSMQEGISEFSADATKDTIANIMHEEGIPEEKIEALTEKGHELLSKEPAKHEVSEEKEIQGLKQTSGREGSPKPYNYPSEPGKKAQHNIPYPFGKNTEEISQRERLEAMKEGLEEFLETPHKTPHQEEAVIEKLEEIQQQLSGLPPDPPEPEEPEIEDVTDKQAQAEGWQDARERKTWLDGTESVKQIPKNVYKPAKLNTIKGMYSQGLENKGKVGYDGFGELMDDLDDTINDMGTMF